MAENVVRVSGLTKTFGKNTVLSNVNISLERGKIYGFIGQNGAGKTTLINHINGLLFPDEGEIELFGASDSKGLVNARKRIGLYYLFWYKYYPTSVEHNSRQLSSPLPATSPTQDSFSLSVSEKYRLQIL